MMVNLHGTAGLPILNLLSQNNLVNVLIVVTRYFGGILLGTGGLFKAYSDSAKNTIIHSNIVDITKVYTLKIEIDYNLTNKLEHYIQNNNYNIENIEYSDNVNITLIVPINAYDIFSKFICELSNKQAKIDIINSKFA